MRAGHETGQSPARRLAVKNGQGSEETLAKTPSSPSPDSEFESLLGVFASWREFSYFPFFSCSRAPARIPGSA